ncbi:hypothetical protein C7S14_0207 [Burkholderia cepacia]|nr:hypothetical protein C7S14_0207 [Burkholderia cepacia]
MPDAVGYGACVAVRSAAGLLFNRWHQRHAELQGQYERPAPY